ncbi:SAC3 domain-containing protein 1 isoform X1 [Ixodes scapularis]|uniref:SAC3 domain-containing protein 1 isoform X1 n=1 Tax=Ixodes scapularis TaxID=6945 RepID=UPI001C388980|nr:SAC3 domain-containing protein 1 isoform X1 [Ixodes scapularis]
MAGVVGRCGDMCPRREREWREKERLLDPFEIVPGTEKQARPKADRDRAVKQFARSAAGQRQASPDELRPPDVLLRTTSYLLRTIVPSKEASWSSIYHFVWDRLWSVRQDMTVQGIRGTTCITVLEQAVRFYVYASFRSCQEGPNSGFDAHINGQHLQECLKRLLVLYCEMDWKTHPHQPEMEAIYLLHNLGSAEALAHAVSLPRCLREQVLVRAAMEASLAHWSGNFVRVLRNYRAFPFLLACALHPHLGQIRRHALQVLTSAYSSRNCRIPMPTLSQWLHCTDKEARDICLSYNVPLENSEVKFLKGTGDFSARQMSSVLDPYLKQALSRIDVAAVLTPDAGTAS